MSGDTRQSLARAFELIEADEHQQALNIVKPIIENEPNNADAWWVYIHAVADEDEAREGLNRLSELDSDYPGLSELQNPQDFDDDFDDLDLDFESDFDDDPELVSQSPGQGEEASGNNRMRLLRFLVPVVIIVAVIVLALLLLNSGNGDDGEDDTNSVADVSTTAPTADIIIVPDVDVTEDVDAEETSMPSPTLEADETEPVIDAQIADTLDVADIFSDFDLRDADPTTRETTSLGETVIVSICGEGALGDQREVADRALLTLAEQETAFDPETDAVAIRIENCTADTTVNTIAVSLASLQAAVVGDLDEAAFRQTWQAVEIE